jgi:hypothetical protein
MAISEMNRKYLAAMGLLEEVSRSLRTTSWIFGGFLTDVHAGRVLREHGDLDYLTSNLYPLKGRFEEVFSNHGWQTHTYSNGDLRLKKDSIKLQLGNVEIDEVVRWTHNGEKGSLLFPLSWLRADVMPLYEMDLHVVAPELQYVLKEHPELMNPGWLPREQDILEKEYLRELLLKRGIDIRSLPKRVRSL